MRAVGGTNGHCAGLVVDAAVWTLMTIRGIALGILRIGCEGRLVNLTTILKLTVRRLVYLIQRLLLSLSNANITVVDKMIVRSILGIYHLVCRQIVLIDHCRRNALQFQTIACGAWPCVSCRGIALDLPTPAAFTSSHHCRSQIFTPRIGRLPVLPFSRLWRLCSSTNT